ncbi:MAG: peptidyl-prolyl cis-trans isomerase [Halioglobus sp.]|nr:peptidyl-prolyl cis-trans isomerase [Halioglobus sp.]
MTFLSRLNRPWLHFILLGALLFYLQGVLFPAPKPVVGPLNPSRVEALLQQWFSTTGRLPTEEQKQRMVAAELDRDMLFQEALEMKLHLYDTVIYQRLLRNMRFLGLGEGKTEGEMYDMALDMRLHLGDEVVKRRMIQVIEQMMLAANPPRRPSEEELAAEFERRRQELRRPPRYSIEHIYFNREREDEFDAAVATIAEQQMDATRARELSSPFLPGYRFRRQTPDQLARHFGASFVKNLMDAQPAAGAWVGPVRSTYGLHYVWVEALEPERDATLEEVRTQLLRDMEARERARSLRESIDALRENYEVRT